MLFSVSTRRVCATWSSRTTATSMLTGPTIRKSSLNLYNCLLRPPSLWVPFSQRIMKRTFSQGAQKETSKEAITKAEQVVEQTFSQRFLGPKVMPERGTAQWYREMVLLCTVFAITGTSTMVLVRPAMSDILGLNGSLKEGPWSYRICSIVIMTPLYACMLVLVGTTFGRHAYFRHFAVKMFSRFGIPPELMDASYHQTAKNFRKW
jgi:hypothetical protein